jgi:hypothetical protein
LWHLLEELIEGVKKLIDICGIACFNYLCELP